MYRGGACVLNAYVNRYGSRDPTGMCSSVYCVRFDEIHGKGSSGGRPNSRQRVLVAVVNCVC